MSKKNRRKSLAEREDILIKRGNFSVDDSKLYIIATIIMFHIVPLLFKMFGETGSSMYTMSYMTTNVIFLSVTGIIYGMKKGFDMKYPFIMTFLAFLSLVFYGEFAEGETAKWCVILGITYLIIAYAGTVLGAFIKKLFRLY